MPNKLTTKEFWINPNQDTQFNRHTDHGIDGLIKKYIPETKNGDCLEIGSYPGPFLSTFGDLGYTLHGVDFHPDNVIGLPNWLKSQGYNVGEFTCMDFFDFNPQRQFDVVASFGFIEHFENFQEVIRRHTGLVKDEGYLIITTPNFRGGIQNWLHRNFDKKNLALHNTNSMNPVKWKEQLQSEGFEVLYYGNFGDFWFWHGNEILPKWKENFLWLIVRVIPRIRKLLWFQSRSFSAYAGIVAIKSKKVQST